MNVDVCITGARIATMRDAANPYGMVDEAALGIRDGTIVHIGRPEEVTAAELHDRPGLLITPALIDCHTHLVFGGQRIHEFEQRLGGASYEEIARAGGGIISTVNATRQASADELFAGAARRIQDLLASGVGTVEIKSGYGLTTADELEMLRVARRLADTLPIRVSTSLLAAHAVPPEHTDDPGRYIDLVCEEMIPPAAEEGLADAVDGFLERIAFDRAQIRRVFDAAHQAGLPVRLHADQLSDGGGAALAAEYGALSADHLEHAARDGIEAMARAGTVAVVIPGASTFLNEPVRPPIDVMRSSGVPVAVSTDLNPGTSPVGSLQTAMWLAVARFRLTPAEALAGTTRHAAAALGLTETGVIDLGKRADLTVWDTDDPAALSYWVGRPLCREVWVNGSRVFDRTSP